ncbi:hypothetical protein BD289DRAFT_441544 [Coniella lustricola]|uniref:Uncharacterized protein n=1 Tax=Coniella lustricola TaxID=2025994 RepID=A0A2T2ZZB2_9PEZI|nr:hypothetical protein BD289DRAFT_441544 [Coniella lustricola]
MSASGSGGFNKYRCKYFFTYNCQNWVYVSSSACANCLADGRDAVALPAHQEANLNATPKDICVPYFANGVLKYSLMEVVVTDHSGQYWELREKVSNSRIPVVPTTSAQPPPPAFIAASGLPAHARG